MEMTRYIRPVMITAMAAFAVAAPVVCAADDDSPKTRQEERRALREAEKKAKEELKKAKKAGDEAAIAQAEAEFRMEIYGHHDFWYGNLIKLLRETDWAAMRARLLAYAESLPVMV